MATATKKTTADDEPTTVRLRHPDSKTPQEVRLEDLPIWKSQGWREASDDDEPEPATTPPLADMSVAQMKDFARENDIDLDGATKQAEIRDTIAASTVPPQPSPAADTDAG